MRWYIRMDIVHGKRHRHAIIYISLLDQTDAMRKTEAERLKAGYSDYLIITHYLLIFCVHPLSIDDKLI